MRSGAFEPDTVDGHFMVQREHGCNGLPSDIPQVGGDVPDFLIVEFLEQRFGSSLV